MRDWTDDYELVCTNCGTDFVEVLTVFKSGVVLCNCNECNSDFAIRSNRQQSSWSSNRLGKLCNCDVKVLFDCGCKCGGS